MSLAKLGCTQAQKLLSFHQSNLLPEDLSKHGVSFSILSSDTSYRQLVSQELESLFAPKLIKLFPGYRAVIYNFAVKRAKVSHSAMPFHQDPPLIDESSLQSFGIWVPLMEVNEQNGCLQVVEGSHLLDREIRPISSLPENEYIVGSPDVLSDLQQIDLVSIPMKAGQALIYDKRLWHGSPPNLTASERVAAICSLVPKQVLSHFCYRKTSTSTRVELFEVEDEFYDRYILGQRPEGVKRLGTVDYKVEPLTTELLVEKLETGNSNSERPAWTNDQVTFKSEFLEKFNPLAQKIAVLVSNEFEGFSKNGGIGTYTTTLSQKLVADGWTVILLLCQADAEFQGEPCFGEVHHVFSTHETAQVLNLQLIHRQILSTTQQTDLSKSFDHQSFCCLFFIQAIIATFPDAVVYAEFPEIWGFGYRTIQAKQSGLLGNSCLIGVTAHGGFEWLQETNGRYSTNHTPWLWQAYHYEQFSYENADVINSPSRFLKAKLSHYGWKTEQVNHLPNFVPAVNPSANARHPAQDGPAQNNPVFDRISVTFFGRLEERKGLCTFVEAVRLLDPAIAPQIHLIFIGKVIPLQSSQLEHLNSQQYIDRELGDAFTYTLLSDLSSQEAIQAIADLPQPIVCLTSLQENFPNVALEMGQLPVSLVVSDTGGFRETLELIERSDAVHWFQPGNAHALAQTLTQAIQAYPENPAILEQTEIDSINHHLLNQRLEFMSQAFLEAAPKEPTPPTVTIALICWQSTTTLLQCLTSLAAQTYEQFDVIIWSPVAADESVQAAIAQAQTQFPQHKYLNSEANWTLGETYNHLVDQSTGEYFLLFSPDQIATPDLVEKLVAAAVAAEAVAVVCPQMIAAGSEPEAITLIDGNLLKLLEFNHRHDLTALFAKTFLKEFRYSQDRGLQALNWQLFATAIATDQAIAYYPYPLYAIRHNSQSSISVANLAKERYYLRQYLFQIKPEQWNQRQINLLLTGFEQLSQIQSQPPPSSRQDQAWMTTAQQMHSELTQSQNRLTEIEAWNRELRTGKDWLESQWQAWMLRGQKAEWEWGRARSLIQQMQSSRFWKLRQVWFKLKRKLGRIGIDPLQPSAHALTPGVQKIVTQIAGQKIRFFQPVASRIPVISVISSCFEDYQYVETTYRSLINQTLQNFEWIIVDDGSTNPAAKAFLASLPQRTAKIRVLSPAAHQGVAASYNTAIAQANGNYLCFLDIGGILDPTYLEKCVLFLETHPQVSVVNSYAIAFQAQEHWWQPYLNQPQSLFSQTGLISHPVYRKTDFDKLGGFDDSLQSLADWERCLKAISQHQVGWTIPEYLDCCRSTDENTPVAQHHTAEMQQAIATIHSRYQTFFTAAPTTSLEPQPLNLHTLNFRVNVENQRTIPNPGKRILLFCEALGNSKVDQWNLDLVLLLEQHGYDVAIVTTSPSDHPWQEFFYRATPDIFHLRNLGERSHWLALIRYLLDSRQIDGILISGSQLAYAFLSLIRVEFSQITLMDYIHAGSAITQNNEFSPIHSLSQSLDYRLVASQRQARESTGYNSTFHSKTKVCSTQADVEGALVEAIKARQTFVPTKTNVELEETLRLLLENLQEPVIEHQPETSKDEAPAEPNARQLLKLLLKKLVKR